MGVDDPYRNMIHREQLLLMSTCSRTRVVHCKCIVQISEVLWKECETVFGAVPFSVVVRVYLFFELLMGREVLCAGLNDGRRLM